jgi:uncharacterized protein
MVDMLLTEMERRRKAAFERRAKRVDQRRGATSQSRVSAGRPGSVNPGKGAGHVEAISHEIRPGGRSNLTRVVISGASGLIGTTLASSLRSHGVTVHRLVRRAPSEPTDLTWNPADGRLDARAIDGVDAVINLAGERIDQRWTESARRAIHDSRTQATSLLARTVASLAKPPRAFVSASAIGIYGNGGEGLLDESSPAGDGFLATVVRDWEAATALADNAGIRVVLARSGVVVSERGGALARMLPPFRLGLGGKAGSGEQWTSWISLTDEARALEFLLDREDVRGPVNLVAPNPVRNVDFAKALGHALHRPSVATVPTFVLDMMFGEMARNTLLASQRVVPGVLTRHGFRFQHPTLDQALAAELRS